MSDPADHATTDAQGTPDPAATAGPTTTRLSGRWLRKMGLFLAVLLGFGTWGLYDALIAYPNRGENDASYRLYTYLGAASDAHGFALPLGIPEGVSARDHFAALGDAEPDLIRSAGGSGAQARDAREDLALLGWLRSLSVLGRLSDERVESDLAADTPEAMLKELGAEWSAKNPPKPLSFYDIPVQWVFVIVGYGGGLWLGLHMLRVASKKYAWDPAPMRLTLPGGSSIVPSDVAEFDKRKWDKFLFFFKIKPDHAQLGGREIKLDLYQYIPLEDWRWRCISTPGPRTTPRTRRSLPSRWNPAAPIRKTWCPRAGTQAMVPAHRGADRASDRRSLESS